MQIQSLGQEAPVFSKRHHTPIFLLGKFHGERSLVGYSPWGCKEVDMTDWAHTEIKSCRTENNICLLGGLWEFWTRPKWRAAATKACYTKNVSNSGKMVLWDASPPSSQSVGFPKKVTISSSNTSPWFIGLSWGGQYELGLSNTWFTAKTSKQVGLLLPFRATQ